MVKVSILWGESPEPGTVATTYEFATQAEADAFLLGVSESDGWLGYELVNEGEHKNPDYTGIAGNPVYIASFQGQAWVNDHALNVDDSFYEYPLTDEESAQVQTALDVGHDLDFLKSVQHAPAPVEDFNGPFEITVRDFNPDLDDDLWPIK